MGINDQLALLADKLDEAQLPHLANTVDEVLQGMVKTAQYVGVQGYWIRNDRCWQNCYRQKRANTNKAAQEIWFECQKEYQNSINKDDSAWDKYAGSDSIVKTAEYRQEENKFASVLKSRIEKGEDPATAAFAIIEKQHATVRSAYIEAASRILRVAETLDGVNDELSIYAGTLAGDLTKEAGFLDFTRGLGRAVDQGARSVNYMGASARSAGKLKKALAALTKALSDYNNTLNAVWKKMQGFEQSGNIKVQQQATQVNQQLGTLNRLQIPPAYTQKMNQIINTVNGLEQQEPQQQQQQQQAPQQQTQQNTPEGDVPTAQLPPGQNAAKEIPKANLGPEATNAAGVPGFYQGGTFYPKDKLQDNGESYTVLAASSRQLFKLGNSTPVKENV